MGLQAMLCMLCPSEAILADIAMHDSAKPTYPLLLIRLADENMMDAMSKLLRP